jgi:hypothetical protein
METHGRHHHPFLCFPLCHHLDHQPPFVHSPAPQMPVRYMSPDIPRTNMGDVTNQYIIYVRYEVWLLM